MRCQSEKVNLSKRYNSYNVAPTIGKACQNCQKIDAFLFGGKYASSSFIDSKVFKRKRQSGKEIVKLAEQPALGVDMGDVEEITDSRREELIDKELIHLEETDVSTKTEAGAKEELQE